MNFLAIKVPQKPVTQDTSKPAIFSKTLFGAIALYIKLLQQS
jgi:hypothetical protein